MAKPARAITFVQFVAIALLSFMIGGAVAACKRRDTDADDAARAKVFSGAVTRSEADREAKRVAADLRKEREKAETEARANALPPLLEAAQNADAKEVKALLANGADPKTLNEALLLVSHSEPLVVGDSAANDPSLPFAATAKLLLEKGANIEVRDKNYGATPLLLAARYGETAVVKLLLEKGAKIEAKDPYGGTALMDAAAWGRGWIIKILLDRGAQIEAKDNKGFTALLIAAQGQGYPTADAVQMLLPRGADIEARNNKGESALMLAASDGGFEYVKIVRILLKSGADARAQDLKGRTPLDMAVAKGRSKTASLLRAAAAKSS
jgi:ankyrin repeat protein